MLHRRCEKIQTYRCADRLSNTDTHTERNVFTVYTYIHTDTVANPHSQKFLHTDAFTTARTESLVNKNE